MSKQQHGFGIVELVLIVVVLAIGGALGYAYFSNVNKSDSTEQASQTASQETSTLPEVKSTNDLSSVEQSLNSMDIDSAVDTADAVSALQ